MVSARITTKGLSCQKCSLHILTHTYSSLTKYSEEGKHYLVGRCPGCTTPFRTAMFEVEVVNRHPGSFVGSSIQLFSGKPTLDPFITRKE